MTGGREQIRRAAYKIPRGIKGMWFLLNASGFQQEAHPGATGKTSLVNPPTYPRAPAAQHAQTHTSPHSATGSLCKVPRESSGREETHTGNRPESVGKEETTNLSCSTTFRGKKETISS